MGEITWDHMTLVETCGIAAGCMFIRSNEFLPQAVHLEDKEEMCIFHSGKMVLKKAGFVFCQDVCTHFNVILSFLFGN